MMPYAGASPHAIAAILFFALIYLWFLLRNILRGRLELYDFFMLSAVAVLPVIFAVCPDFVNSLTEATGVGMSFFIMDGVLFAVAYYFLIRLAMLVHAERKKTRVLVQELAVLRADFETFKRQHQSDHDRDKA